MLEEVRYMYNATDNELNKVLLDTLNQHGLDAMLSIVHDEIERAYAYGYEEGQHNLLEAM